MSYENGSFVAWIWTELLRHFTIATEDRLEFVTCESTCLAAHHFNQQTSSPLLRRLNADEFCLISIQNFGSMTLLRSCEDSEHCWCRWCTSVAEIQGTLSSLAVYRCSGSVPLIPGQNIFVPIIQRDYKRLTQFRTSISPELHRVIEWST